MRVVDYFSAVDKDGNGTIEFEEAFVHCFPYVPKDQLETLLKWMDPRKYDKDLYNDVFADSALQGLAASAAVDFDTVLNQVEQKCEQFLKKRENKDDIVRCIELKGIKKDVVSKLTKANYLKKNEKFKSAAIKWLEEQKKNLDMQKNPFNSCDASLSSNFFSATIFVISSAIQKLSRHNPTKDAPVTRLFRGLSNRKAPDLAFCELAFLSSSLEESVADEIALESGSTTNNVLILDISAPIGGFAYVKDYSQ